MNFTAILSSFRRIPLLARLAILAAIPLGILAGCGGGGAASDPGGIILTASSSADASADINGLHVTVPAGAAPDNTRMTLSNTDVALPNLGSFVVSSKISLTLPASKFSKGLTISSPGNRVDGSAALLIQIDGVWDVIYPDPGQTTFTLSEKELNAAEGTSGSSIKIIFGVRPGVTQNRGAPSPSHLVLLSGSGGLGSNSALIIPGIFSNPQTFQMAADRLRSVYGYVNVYGVDYINLEGVELGATSIENLLQPLGLPSKSIDLWGHSMGGLVARFMIEQHGYSKPFRRLYTVDTPHLGAVLADAATVAKVLSKFSINFPALVINIAGVFFPTDQICADLSKASAVCHTLNSSFLPHRALVDYMLVANNADWIVSEDSQVAAGVLMEEHTSGAFYRGTLSAGAEVHFEPNDPLLKKAWFEIAQVLENHGNLLETEGGLDTLTNGFMDYKNTLLSVDAPAFVVDTNVIPWHYTFQLRNDRAHPVVVEEVMIVTYDKFGAYYLQQWFSPGNPQLFPTEPVRIDTTIPSHDGLGFQIDVDPADQVNGLLHTATSRVICRVYDSYTGSHNAIVGLFHLNRGGEAAADPDTRSVEMPKVPGRVGPVRGGGVRR